MKAWYLKLRDISGMIVLCGVRLLENVFPPDILRCVLFPFAAILALRDVFRRRWLEIPFNRLPATWPRVKTTRALLFKLRVRFHLTRLITHWPDRLSEPRWRERFKIEGSVLDEAIKAKRPAILVSAHFGPFYLPGYLFRAAGFPMATFIGDIVAAKSMVRRYKNRLTHFPGLRPFFSEEDHLREVCRFLEQGNMLRMAFDYPTGKQINIRADGANVHFATGSIRLAALTDSILIPFAISESKPWKFVMHLGAPVPSHLLGKSPEVEGAAIHIVNECFKFFKISPEESGHELLRIISDSAPFPQKNVS